MYEDDVYAAAANAVVMMALGVLAATFFPTPYLSFCFLGQLRRLTAPNDDEQQLMHS